MTTELTLAPSQRGDMANAETRGAIVAELKGQIMLIQEAMQSVLLKGVHYGTIPGTQRPSLWQPGAEALCQMFRFQTSLSLTGSHEDWEAGVFAYTYKCVLADRTGQLITEREATCSTEEVRYKEMQFDREKNGRELKGRPAAEMRETVMQMAQKRAYVSAVKASAAASATFSMDDELVTDEGGMPRRSAPRRASSPTNSALGNCPVHNLAFFQTANMRSAAHRLPDGGWCNKPAASTPAPGTDDTLNDGWDVEKAVQP